MSFFEDLATYLDTQNASLVYTNESGRNVFVATLPDTPNDCIALLGLSGTTIGQARDVKELVFPRLQVITRAVEFEDAATLMETVRSTLHGMLGVSLSNYRVLRMHAEQEAYPIGTDDQDRFEFSMNLTGEYHAT